MSEYRRFIAYIYEYTNGKKNKNTGFAKVESRNGVCRMQIHLQKIPQEEDALNIYGFVREGSWLLGIFLGKIQIQGANGDARIQTSSQNIGGSRYTLGQLAGLWVESSRGWKYLTVFDEGEIDVAKLVTELPEALKETGVSEQAERSEEPGVSEKAKEQEVSEKVETAERREVSEKAETAEGQEVSENEEKAKEQEVLKKAEMSEGQEVLEKTEKAKKQEVSEKRGMSKGQEVLAKGEMPKGQEVSEQAEMSKERKVSEQAEMSEKQEVSEKGEMPKGQKVSEQAEMPRGQKVSKKPEVSGEAQVSGLPQDPKLSETELSRESERTGAGEKAMAIHTEEGRSEEVGARQDETAGAEEEVWQKKEGTAETVRGVQAGHARETATGVMEHIQAKEMSMKRPQASAAQIHSQEAAACPQPRQCRRNYSARYMNMDQKWQCMSRRYSHFQPFDDDEVADCLQIAPRDLHFIHQGHWRMGNNSFLMHGFSNYRHLLFAKKRDGSYFLGIPGVFEKQEQVMANMFGFEHFKEAAAQRPGGRFGYWCRGL